MIGPALPRRGSHEPGPGWWQRKRTVRVGTLAKDGRYDKLVLSRSGVSGTGEALQRTADEAVWPIGLTRRSEHGGSCNQGVGGDGQLHFV